MVERFASHLSNILIEMGSAQEKDRPFLAYGLFCLMSDTVQIGLLLVISLLSNTVAQMALFTFCFGLLKRTIGGWHARHHSTCLALFTALAVACVQFGGRLPPDWVLPGTLMLSAAMWVIVWQKAPVEHPNNPQTSERLSELKRISRWLASLELICIAVPGVLLCGTSFGRYLLTAAMGAFTAATALIPKVPLDPEKGGELS